MNVINKLDDSVVSKIAAGEIITRPLNVVKELVENALDAGASQIVISIDKNNITVDDNGTGIDKAFIQSAFLRHYTSKIATEDDLGTIASLGFRGEALFAISTVSHITLSTKTQQDKVGTRVFLTEGKVLSTESVAKKTGTTLCVENLFYNLPVRKKHLKDFDYEARLITELIEHMALIHPDKSFSLHVSGKQRLYTAQTENVLTRIAEIYGKDFAAELTAVSYEQLPLKLEGYLSDISARGRKIKVLSINGRLVSARSVHSAIKSAYDELRGEGRQEPNYILFIQLPYHMVDVNVHPTKEEVKFLNESLIVLLIKNAVKTALSQTKINLAIPHSAQAQIHTHPADDAPNDTATQRPDFSGANIQPSFDEETAPSPAEKEESFVQLSALFDEEPAQAQLLPEKAVLSIAGAFGGGSASLFGDLSAITKEDLQKLRYAKYAGHLFLRYVILTHSNAMYILDQHAAHERVLYEDMLQGYQNNTLERQFLLLPQKVYLSASELALVIENRQELARLGFEISLGDLQTLQLLSMPVIAGENQTEDMFFAILNYMKEHPVKEVQNRSEIFIARACAAAVKSDKELNQTEVDALIDKLLATQTPFICPHGRDTLIKIEKSRLDKLFGRT